MAEFKKETSKKTVFETVQHDLNQSDIRIASMDDSRPWGGFFVIDPVSLPNFISAFFEKKHQIPRQSDGINLSPKILIVAPEARLSWQYHKRRSELWTVVKGTAGVITSSNDDQPPLKKLHKGDQISLKKGIRHRLIGLDNWSVVAEIWIHSDSDNPSDEDDIVRLEDDYGR